MIIIIYRHSLAMGVWETRLLVGRRFAGGARFAGGTYSTVVCWWGGPLLVERNFMGKSLNSACDSNTIRNDRIGSKCKVVASAMRTH